MNLAAVNYHFGSKEELFQAVLTRRLDPMNQERIELLDRLEREAAGKPIACEKILFAMLIPALRLARDEERGGKNFLRLVGRAYADPAPFIRHFLSEQYAEMIGRYKEAFHKALPHLSRQELTWRLHFVMGALSYTLAGTDALKLFDAGHPGGNATTTSCCCSGWRRSWSPVSRRRRWATPASSSWSRETDLTLRREERHGKLRDPLRTSPWRRRGPSPTTAPTASPGRSGSRRVRRAPRVRHRRARWLVQSRSGSRRRCSPRSRS